MARNDNKNTVNQQSPQEHGNDETLTIPVSGNSGNMDNLFGNDKIDDTDNTEQEIPKQQQVITPEPPKQITPPVVKNESNDEAGKRKQDIIKEYKTPNTGMAGVIAPTVEAVKVAGKGYKVFRLANSKRKGSVYIDGEDDVINPKTGQLERIRLIRGVATIWASEQKSVTEAYFQKNKRSLHFQDRTLRIPEWDTAALAFAEICRHNIDNPSRRTGSKHEFFEWNPQRQEELKLKERRDRVIAITKANEVPDALMRKHASFLNVDFADELGELKTNAGIRADYLLKAEENPKRFLETLNSEEVEVSYAVKKCIRDSRIDLGRLKGQAHWTNGGLIAHIPMNQPAVKYLTEFALLKTEESIAFKQQVLMMANT